MPRVALPGLLLALLVPALAFAQPAGSSPAAPATQRQSQQASPSVDPAKLDDLARRAAEARTAGDSKGAIQLYEQVLRERPSWSEGWWYLGTLFYDSDQYAKAVPAFERAVKLEPALGSGWAFLGLCEFELADYKHSLLHLHQAKKLGVDDAATARVSDYHLALLLNLTGQFEDAASVLIAQFGQEQLTPQVTTGLGLSLLRMPILPAKLDIAKKELVFTAGQALAQIAHQQFSEALETLQTLANEHPDASYLHYSSANVLMSLDRMDEALEQAQAELKVAPSSGETYLLLAKIQLKREKVDDALKAAQQAVKLLPRNAIAHRLLAECYERSGKERDGKEELALAEKLGPPAESASSTSVSSGPDAPQPAPSPHHAEVTELHRQAQAAQQAGSIDEAIQDYRRGLALQPDWTEGTLELTTIYYSTQRPRDALPLAQSLVRLRPGVGTAWALLGLCEFQVGNFDDALVHLSRGRDLGFPKGGAAVSEANYNLGILLNWRGDFDAAHALLLRESKGEFRAADAKFAMGINLLRLRLLPSQVKDADRQMVEVASNIAVDLSTSNYNGAAAKFDELLRLYPDRAYIHDAYGWAMMSISRYDAAVEQFRQEMKKSPQSPEAYLGLATAAIKTHAYKEGRDAAQKAVQLAPDSAMAHAQYGRALVELSELPKGIAELETAVRLAVQIPDLHYSLSRAYAKAGRARDAERERQIFLRLNKQAKPQ